MRKMILAAALLVVTPAFARNMTPAETRQTQHDMKIVLDAAEKGCNERFGTYHKAERDNCIVYIGSRWLKDWRVMHPDIDFN